MGRTVPSLESDFHSKCAFPSRALREPFVYLIEKAEKEIYFVTTSAPFKLREAVDLSRPFKHAIQERGLQSILLLSDPSSKYLGPKPGAVERAERKDIEETIERLRLLQLSKNFQI